MRKGKVAKFTDKGYGFITPDDGVSDVWIHINDVISAHDGYLIRGEPVEFEVAPGRDGRPAAVDIKRNRQKGKVVEARSDGVCFAVAEGGGPRHFFHARHLLGASHEDPAVGEEVEYSPSRDDRGLVALAPVRLGCPLDDRYPLRKFGDLSRLEGLLVGLAELAEPEPWDYRDSPQGGTPILWNYIVHTFGRIEQEAKIAFATDEDCKRHACFNTGLVAQRQEQIMCLFDENPEGGDRRPPWRISAFALETDRSVDVFRPDLPRMACYWGDPSDLVYDLRLGDPVVQLEHVLEDNAERFPKAIAANEHLKQAALKWAVLCALNRVRRNYKTGVPQYHEGKIDLLLPLCLCDPARVDLALVVEKKKNGRLQYIGKTVLPLDWAYRNARLVAKPDSDWLKL